MTGKREHRFASFSPFFLSKWESWLLLELHSLFKWIYCLVFWRKRRKERLAIFTDLYNQHYYSFILFSYQDYDDSYALLDPIITWRLLVFLLVFHMKYREPHHKKKGVGYLCSVHWISQIGKTNEFFHPPCYTLKNSMWKKLKQLLSLLQWVSEYKDSWYHSKQKI